MAASTIVPDEATANAIRQKMMETGDWERIQNLLRARLEESGWVDDLKNQAKEQARAQETPNLEELMKSLSESAASSVSPELKRDLTQEVERVLDDNFEQV
ncbi:hypothetical protein IAT38_001522 [Cryptococcus sp. DSM 104549]